MCAVDTTTCCLISSSSSIISPLVKHYAFKLVMPALDPNLRLPNNGNLCTASHGQGEAPPRPACTGGNLVIVQAVVFHPGFGQFNRNKPPLIHHTLKRGAHNVDAGNTADTSAG